MSPSKRYYEITGPAALDWNDVRRQSQASTVTTVTAYRVGQVVEMFARPDHDRDSIIQGQLRHVNKRVANHPLCVIGFRQSDDGQQQLVTCLQMTTFDGQLLNEKCTYYISLQPDLRIFPRPVSAVAILLNIITLYPRMLGFAPLTLTRPTELFSIVRSWPLLLS